MPVKARLTPALALVVAAAGCSSPVANNSEAPAANIAMINTPEPAQNVVMPDLAANTQAQPAAACPQEAGVTCTGPLIIRAEGFNLLAGDRYNMLQGVLVFESRTGGPVRVVMLREPVTAQLDRGGMLQSGFDGSLGGIEVCRDDGPSCLRDRPELFRTIVPGDSPLRVRTNLRGQKDSATRATMPTVQTAELTFQVHVVEGNGSGDTLSISIPGVPLRNQIAP